MNQQALSSFIWSVADLLRGDYKQSEYGKIILPFTVLRRLDCVLENTKEAVLSELARTQKSGLNPEAFLLRKAQLNFYNTAAAQRCREAGKLAPLTDTGSGEVREKEVVWLTEIISKVNELFEGELTDDDMLVYVNNVLKGKLLESPTLIQQASNNTKEQFANSPDLSVEIMNAIMDALAAHQTMSRQALDSEKVRRGLKDILLGPARLWESLRSQGPDLWS